MKQICSINGSITDHTKAVLPLTQIEAQYGFGVYETIKQRNFILYFVSEHVERLLHSAKEISLAHSFKKKQITAYITDFVKELAEESCNLKVLLYGSREAKDARIIILASAPFYPQRKWYKEGVKLMTYEYERWMPQAKTLNMVASYFIYKKAQDKGCYDALLYDHTRNILEGTRTNMYLIKGKKIYSPPKDKILEGVTMMSLEKVLQNSEYNMLYKNIKLNLLQQYDGMFLTSTSSKILPVKQIDNIVLPISPEIFYLIKRYDEALEKSKGDFSQL